jgi:parallel beta-helix repeat protein
MDRVSCSRRSSNLLLFCCFVCSFALVPAAFAAEGRIPIYPPDPPNTTIVIGVSGSYLLTDNLDFVGDVSVISVQAPNVSIDLGGHRIGTTSTIARCVEIIDQTGVRISNGKIFGGAHGIYFYNSLLAPATVEVQGISLSGQSDSATNAGIYVEGVSGGPVSAVITGNSVKCSAKVSMRGVAVKYVNDSRIERNVIFGCARGIEIDTDAMKVSFQGNTISGNTTGIGAFISPGLRSSAIRDNIISGNTSIGINIYGDNNSIDLNTVSDNNSYGMEIYGSNNSIRSNTVSGNMADGIYIMSSAGNNSIEFNTVSHNSEGIRIEGSANTIRSNTASGNMGNGIYLFNTAFGNIVDKNAATTNGNCGIRQYCPTALSLNNVISDNRTPANPGGACFAQQTLQCGGTNFGQAFGIDSSAQCGNLLCGNVP